MPMLTTWRRSPRRRAVGALADRLGEGEHRVENRMDLFAERRAAARCAQRGMEHRAPLGVVDGRAGQHGVALCLDAAFARQVGEEAQRRRVDEVLRQVGEDLGRVERHRFEPARIARERLAQVEVAAVRLEVAGERRPGGGAVAARRRRGVRAERFVSPT